MTITKNKMVREIGRRTRLKNGDVQKMLEVLIEIWSEELINGGRIELENFLVIETQKIEQSLRQLTLRTSKHLKRQLNHR